MLYIANPCGSEAVTAAMLSGTLGYIDTPAQGNKRPDGVTWCADNGAFSDKFDEGKWWRFLVANAHRADSCVFAVAPDVVGDAQATLDRSLPWLPKIRALGYPAAFVAQNGATIDALPWDEFDCLFIGGCVECLEHGPRVDALRTGRGSHQRFWCDVCSAQIYEWKLSAPPRVLAAEAKRLGKWVHVGRVNSARRFRYSAAPYPYGIGADSADGTYLTAGPDVNLPKVLAWARNNDQGSLFGGVA